MNYLKFGIVLEVEYIFEMVGKCIIERFFFVVGDDLDRYDYWCFVSCVFGSEVWSW